MAFKKLVRFLDSQGSVHFGDVGDGQAKTGEEAEILTGDLDTGFQTTGKTEKIQKVSFP
jgi:hypothetical protein